MSASCKYSTISNAETEKVTNDLLNEIKKAIKKNKGNKNNDVSSIEIELLLCGHGLHPFGSAADKDDYIDLTIRTCGYEKKGLGTYDVRTINHKLGNALKEYDKTLEFEDKDIYLRYGDFTPDFTIIGKVIAFSKPCKEFTKLVKLVEKHCGKKLGIKDCYEVNLFGKRSCYGESGERYYLCYNPKKCQYYIDVLKHKTSRDSVSFNVNKYDDIDTSYSIRYETECYGSRSVMPHIEILTPKGKSKLVG